MKDVYQIKNRIVNEFAKIQTLDQVQTLRVKYLGKNGEITELLKMLKDISHEEKKVYGKAVNQLKMQVEKLLSEKTEEFGEANIQKNLNASQFDITLPAPGNELGSLHPITLVQREVEEILSGMGFMIADGPEVETDYFNFQALNMPPTHPARDMQDTYYLENGQVLRTQTSACQGRIMINHKPPLKIIAHGRCFRNEALDAGHENIFFQLEGMMIDKDISISNLIYVMKLLLTEVFQKEVKIRLRPGYFPFVEPAFELDLNCLICGGTGCPTCKHSGWIEILPCGMIHPNVLKLGGIDTEEYTGFAFGMGLTRLAMMKYGIKDIRLMNSGDLRVLKQIGV